MSDIEVRGKIDIDDSPLDKFSKNAHDAVDTVSELEGTSRELSQHQLLNIKEVDLDRLREMLKMLKETQSAMASIQASGLLPDKSYVDEIRPKLDQLESLEKRRTLSDSQKRMKESYERSIDLYETYQEHESESKWLQKSISLARSSGLDPSESGTSMKDMFSTITGAGMAGGSGLGTAGKFLMNMVKNPTFLAAALPVVAGSYVLNRVLSEQPAAMSFARQSQNLAALTGGDFFSIWATGGYGDKSIWNAGIYGEQQMAYAQQLSQYFGPDSIGAKDDILKFAIARGIDPGAAVGWFSGLRSMVDMGSGGVGGASAAGYFPGIVKGLAESPGMRGRTQLGMDSMSTMAGSFRSRTGLVADAGRFKEMAGMVAGFAATGESGALTGADALSKFMATGAQAQGKTDAFLLRAFYSYGEGEKSLQGFYRWKQLGGSNFFNAVKSQMVDEVGPELAGVGMYELGFAPSVPYWDDVMSKAGVVDVKAMSYGDEFSSRTTDKMRQYNQVQGFDQWKALYEGYSGIGGTWNKLKHNLWQKPQEVFPDLVIAKEAMQQGKYSFLQTNMPASFGAIDDTGHAGAFLQYLENSGIDIFAEPELAQGQLADYFINSGKMSGKELERWKSAQSIAKKSYYGYSDISIPDEIKQKLELSYAQLHQIASRANQLVTGEGESTKIEMDARLRFEGPLAEYLSVQATEYEITRKSQ